MLFLIQYRGVGDWSDLSFGSLLMRDCTIPSAACFGPFRPFPSLSLSGAVWLSGHHSRRLGWGRYVHLGLSLVCWYLLCTVSWFVRSSPLLFQWFLLQLCDGCWTSQSLFSVVGVLPDRLLWRLFLSFAVRCSCFCSLNCFCDYFCHDLSWWSRSRCGARLASFGPCGWWLHLRGIWLFHDVRSAVCLLPTYAWACRGYFPRISGKLLSQQRWAVLDGGCGYGSSIIKTAHWIVWFRVYLMRSCRFPGYGLKTNVVSDGFN